MEERLDVVIDSSSAKRGIDVLVQSMRGMVDAAKNTETATTKLFDVMNTGLNKLESAFMSLKSIMLSFGVVIGIFKELGIELSKFQAFISAMSVSVGGIEQSRVQFAALMEMSDRLGVSVNSLSHNYTQLSAASVGTTLTQAAMTKGFESFAIASRVLHLSSADTRLVFYALTQMISKGTVSMEELRRQLGEKLPGAMNIAARSVNTDMQTFEAAIRKGTVDSAKLFPIFAAEVERTFGKSLPLAAKAYDAEVNRLTNNLQKLIVVMYDVGVADSFTKVIKELNRILGDSEIGKAFGVALKSIADDMARFLGSITPEKVREYITGFSTALSNFARTITEDVLPAIIKLADNVGKIAAGYLIIKGMGVGARIGGPTGPYGAAVGAAIGGAVAAGGAWGIGEWLSTPKAYRSSGGSAGRMPPELLAHMQAEEKARMSLLPISKNPFLPFSPQMFMGEASGLNWAPGVSKAKLSDVLRPGKPEGPTALERYIQQLGEKQDKGGDTGNIYEAMRTHVQFLKSNPLEKKPGLASKAEELISGLEERGVEYKPLTDRIQARINARTQETPDTIDRQVSDLLNKYQRGDPTKKQELTDAAAQFRAQYYSDLARAQDVFLMKQDEIIRRIGDEKQLYTEQIDLIGKSALQRDQILKRLDMEKKLEHEIATFREEAKRNEGKVGGLVFDEIAFRKKAKTAIDATIDELQRLQAAGRTVKAGYDTAVMGYLDSLTNYASITEGFVTRTFKGMEDALVQFTQTSKLDFKSLANSIIADLMRIQIQQSIMKPLANMAQTYGGSILGSLGQLFGFGSSSSSSYSLASSGSGIGGQGTSGLGLKAPVYAQGTNYVPNTGLAFLHKGEAVVPAALNNSTQAPMQVFIDATGADSAAIARLESSFVALNASIERRAISVVSQARLRNVR